MRPLHLEVEGFTSFRERLSIDLAGLDLFAITGPTGAGKSSLIDAMVFALYGQVPRVGDDCKQLISHGAERMSVLFDFAVGEERFRVGRTARRAASSQQRLERLVDGEAQPLADRVKDIRSRIEEILGLDYDGFTRSVVLPQGRFDQLLRGEPKERRKILVALLNLGVYDEMQRLANQRAAAARQEAAFIARQLERDYSDATPEARAAREEELTRAEREAASVDRELRAIGEGLSIARRLRTAHGELETLARDGEQERRRRREAEQTLARAGDRRRALETQLDEVRARIEALGFDAARHLALVGARPRAEELCAQRRRLEALEGSVGESEQALETGRVAARAAEAALAAAETDRTGAERRLELARAAREEAHRRHAAQALRRGLRPGEACPVCERTIRRLPAPEAAAVEAFDTEMSGAEKAYRRAAESEQKARLALQSARGEVESLERELARLHEEMRQARASVGRVAAGLAEAGFGEAECADAGGLMSRITGELRRLESARVERARLEERQKEIEGARSGLVEQVAAATAQGEAARVRLEDMARREGTVSAAREEALAALRAIGRREGWEDLEECRAGADEGDRLEARQAARQSEARVLVARIATLRAEVDRLTEKILRASELRSRRLGLEADGALLETLARHLRADELVAWIQEEALRRLAEDGSRHLLGLSQGRYELRLGSGERGEAEARADQEFFVVDRWNADALRSVKTLSGGESFLASLALALALAESVAGLATEGRARLALESLFLDEGFGTLDAEALDPVVVALDALHGGQRLVGVVTHMRELAERMPARLEVRRTGDTATAAIV